MLIIKDILMVYIKKEILRYNTKLVYKFIGFIRRKIVTHIVMLSKGWEMMR